MPTEPYRRRQPENSVLYRVLQAHLEEFVARTRDRTSGACLPGFVIRELRAFLGCGILANGFARVRCSQCRQEQLVAFS